MRPQDFDPRKIVETLQGTCMETLESAIQTHYPDMDEDDLTSDDYDYIDNEVFRCECCGWWCESSEQTETNECRGCNPEDEED